MLAAHLLPERDCTTCNETQKRMWGCESPSQTRINLDGVEYSRCPNRPILEDGALFSELFYYYGWYKKGQFPESGVWLDQPNYFVEVITTIDDASRRAERVGSEEEEKRIKLRSMVQNKGRI